MKKLLNLSILVILFSIAAFGSSASASTHGSHSHAGEEGEFGVLYVPCDGTGGKHLMTQRGTGQVMLTNGTKFTDDLFQCTACSQGVIVTNRPNSGWSSPGYYVAVSVPVQAKYGYDFSDDGPKYTKYSASSWSSGIFASMTFR